MLVIQASLLSAQGLGDIKILTEDYPPYNYISSTGELDGVAVRMLAEAYAQLNLSLDKSTVSVQPWPRAYRSALNGSNMLLFSTNRTAQREHLFQWAGPITNVKTVLIAKVERNIEIEEAQDLKDYVIGGIRDDVAMQLVSEELAGEGTLLTSPYKKSLMGMLSLGRIDLWAYSERAAQRLLLESGFDPRDYESVYTLKHSQAYFAFSKNTPANIVARLQLGIDRVKDCQACLSRIFDERE